MDMAKERNLNALTFRGVIFPPTEADIVSTNE